MNGRWKISYKCPLIWLQVFLSHECIGKLDTYDIDRSCKNCQFVIGQNNSKFSNIIFEQANMSLVSVGIVRKPHRSEFINVIAAEPDQAKEQIFLVCKQLSFNVFVFLLIINKLDCTFSIHLQVWSSCADITVVAPYWPICASFKTCKELITE